MLKMILRKLLIAVLAMLVFSTVFSYASVPPGSEHFITFGGLFGFLLMLSAPMYILGGIPVSILLDRYWKWPSIEILLYALCGAFLMLPYSFLLFGAVGRQHFVFMMFGASAAIVFFLIKLLLHKLFKKYGF